VISITSPADGEELKDKTVEFLGTTEPGARVFAGPYEAEVDADGTWRIVLILSEGANGARFVARDAAGNEGEARITVYYSPESTTTTTKAEKEVAEFTAFAKFGSCSEPEPYDIYYGTGEPGSTVYVESAYGSGATTVGAGGEWELQVFFTGLEAGQTIQVKAKDEYGRKKTFDFLFNP
jgi:hypothetical protein